MLESHGAYGPGIGPVMDCIFGKNSDLTNIHATHIIKKTITIVM